MRKFTTFCMIALMAIFWSFQANAESQQRVLLEFFTGTSCPYCGQNGKPAMEDAVNKYDGQVIGVELHVGSGDPFNTQDALQVAGAFGVSGIPTGLISRNPFNTEQGMQFLMPPSAWDQTCGIILDNQEHVVDVELFYSINESTRELTATIEAEFLQDINETGELRFNVYVVEDNLIYNQAGAGNNYNHQNVLRDMIGGPWGTEGKIPSSVSAGDVYSHTYNYTIDDSWKLDDLRFIGLVQEFGLSGQNIRADYIQVLNCVHGEERTISSELTSSGSHISAQNAGEAFQKTFTLKNVAGERISFAIETELSERTPADWTTEVVKGVSQEDDKSEKSQEEYVTLDAEATRDITLKLIPGETLGAGDVKMTIYNRYDPGGQSSGGKITVVSKGIEYCQVLAAQDNDANSLSSQLSQTEANFVDLPKADFLETYSNLTNLQTFAWTLGARGSFSNEEARALRNLIHQDKNILISGALSFPSLSNATPNVLEDLGVEFVSDCFQGAGDGEIRLAGYDGDPITDGFQEEATLKHYLTQAIEITDPDIASPILKHQYVDTVVAARTKLESSKVVLLGINPHIFENTPATEEIVVKSFEWMGDYMPQIACEEEIVFETTDIGTSSEKVFEIENNGERDLEITQLEVEYSYQHIFSIVDADFPMTIPSGEPGEVTVRFAPADEIEYNSYMTIYSNAENNPELNVNLSGEGEEGVGVGDYAKNSKSLDIKIAPNPVTDNAKVELILSEAISSTIKVDLIDVSGKLIRNIANETFSVGESALDFDAGDLSSGKYYIIASSGDKSTVVPLVIER